MLVELAIGDAYGAGFEYSNDNFVRQHNTLEAYVQHPRHHTIQPGQYTDDTQMSLAVAEAVVSGEAWTAQMLAHRFVAAFKRDPREGYASGFYSFLCDVRDGDEFLDRIRPDSDKSGAAMRACPIGIYPDRARVIQYADLQARLTHDTPDGVAAAVGAALAAHYCIHQLGPKSDLPAYLEDHVGRHGQWTVPWTGKVGAQGMMSVRAAITALVACNDIASLLKKCIAYTGDVDTVATIALACAAHSNEYRKNTPQPLVDTLENGTYGFDYIDRLDLKLLAMK
jgi:ADP-ribosylglycohydrolase